MNLIYDYLLITVDRFLKKSYPTALEYLQIMYLLNFCYQNKLLTTEQLYYLDDQIKIPFYNKKLVPLGKEGSIHD